LQTIPNLGILRNATGNHAPGLVERPEKFSGLWDNDVITLFGIQGSRIGWRDATFHPHDQFSGERVTCV
jgi:hypothetical protein